MVKSVKGKIIQSSPANYEAIPIFKHGDFPLIPTGEIVFQPRENIDPKVIIDRYRGQITIVKTSAYGTITIKPVNSSELFSIANKIYESGLVEWYEPDFIFEIIKHQVVNPTDPNFPQQYYLNQANNIDINAPQAWGLSRGLNNVRVAVIDDGVENHEDFNGRVVAGFTPTDPNGFGAPTNNPPPVEEGIIGHGQACAGIIAATQDNVGIAGISPCSQIVPINIFNNWRLNFNFPQGQRLEFLETAQEIAAGINFAWSNGAADVLSNSWGFNTSDPNLIPNSGQIIQAINNARSQGRGGLGSVVVFSSGNSHQQFSGVTFPANVDGVVTVGAIDRNGTIWNYSSRGPQMDLVAPSGNVNLQGDIVTTDRMGNNGYVAGNYVNTFGGTSASCPQVSGVAALMLSINPNLTEAQVVNILRNTATDMGAAGFDNTFGFGRLNAQAAIQQVLPTIAGGNILCTTNSTYTLSFIPPNTTVTWSVSPASFFATTGGASISGTGGTATIRAASNFAGSATLSFVIQGNCNAATVSRTIWVGFPQISNKRLNGSPYFGPTHICPGSHWLQVLTTT